MSLKRAVLSESDRRFIIGRSGGCCNRCRMQIFLENQFSEKARIGDDAHILAYSDEGPRGGVTGAPKDRNTRSNIILLCKNCHAQIDQQALEFTPAVLAAMREEHYQWVSQCLGQVQIQKPRFHYVLYLNVPRIDMYAVANSISLPQLDLGSARCFHDLGFKAGQVMASYTHILNAEEMYAHQIAESSDISNIEAGQYHFIEPMNFRTVAVGKGGDLQAAWALDKSVVYRRFADWKFICLIDPIWITTSSVGSALRSGQAQLCGVVRISRIEATVRKVYASPLFLAQH